MRLAQSWRRMEAGRVDSELLQHRQVANRECRGGAAAGELVERRELLGDQQRVAQGHAGNPERETHPARLARRRAQQQPGIAVIDLVDAEDRVDPRLVRDHDRGQHLGRRRIRQ